MFELPKCNLPLDNKYFFPPEANVLSLWSYYVEQIIFLLEQVVPGEFMCFVTEGFFPGFLMLKKPNTSLQLGPKTK